MEGSVLDMLVREAGKKQVDKDTLKRFEGGFLSSAENLVYITDNCGEIVLDKLLIEFFEEAVPGSSDYSNCKRRGGNQ